MTKLVQLPRVLAVSLLAAGLLCTGSPAAARGQGPQPLRNVSGKVVDSKHHPVKGAIVKLENESSDAIVSYLTDTDGYFHFKRVSTSDNFKVWATANGSGSKKHALSKFSSKQEPFLTLELP